MNEGEDEELRVTLAGRPWAIRWSTADRLCRFVVKWLIYILIATGSVGAATAGLDAAGVVDASEMLDFIGE